MQILRVILLLNEGDVDGNQAGAPEGNQFLLSYQVMGELVQEILVHV